ncbi:MAG: ABC transporter ATP-binding protein [Candidatus Muiribacteriota bacterium]
MEKIIEFKNVYKSFDNKNVLENLNLSIFKGECLCIMGRSGCGKSVLMKIMTGLIRPDSGQVLYYNNSIDFGNSALMNKYRQKVGLVFQNGALFDSLNVYDNISFGLKYNLKLKKDKIKEIVYDIVKELELEKSIFAFSDELSGGMKKRVALARALVMNPEILIYDEPTTGLDAVMVRNIDKLIKETQNLRKTTSIVITHDAGSAYRISDRIAIHSKGKITETGKKDEIFNSQKKDTKLIITGNADE